MRFSVDEAGRHLFTRAELARVRRALAARGSASPGALAVSAEERAELERVLGPVEDGAALVRALREREARPATCAACRGATADWCRRCAGMETFASLRRARDRARSEEAPPPRATSRTG